MAKIQRSHKGWKLVETIHGWYACKGSERVRIAPSRVTNGDDLSGRLVAVAEEREGSR